MKNLDEQLGEIQFVDPIVAGRDIRALKLDPESTSNIVAYALARSEEEGVVAIRGILETATNRSTAREEAAMLIGWGLDSGSKERQTVCRALSQSAGEAGEVFVVHEISKMTQANARAYMSDYLESGGSTTSVLLWLRLAGQVLREAKIKDPETAGVVVDGVTDGLGWLRDRVAEGVDAVLESIDAVMDALAEAGKTVADLVIRVISWTVDELTDLFIALLEGGAALAEIIGAAFRMAYRLASKAVQALLAAGATIVDILDEAVNGTYYQFRRIVYGLVNSLQSLAEILDAVNSIVADALDPLWRQALLAIRYARKRLDEVAGWVQEAVEWAVERGTDMLEALVRAWEEIGENLIDLYEVISAGAVIVWETMGEITVRIGNSLKYVWDFLATDFLEGMFHFIKGVLIAGKGIFDLMLWSFEAGLNVLVETVRAAIDVGTTIGTLLEETIRNPAGALDNLLRALDEIGSTLEELYQAAIVETAEEFLDQVTRTLVEIGRGVSEILDAVKEVVAGAVGTVIGILFTMLGSYRSLTPEEIADAQIVFADSINYSEVRIAIEGPLNDIVFGVQDFVSQNPDSRAFVTNTLINFDVDDGITRHTLIHELTHVWQFMSAGPEYLLQAVGAQVLGAGYNYGYGENQHDVEIDIDHSGTKGTFDAGRVAGFQGGQTLTNANGDFDTFNREQQGQIMMHYFVRRELLGVGVTIGSGTNSEVVDIAPWQLYVDHVQGV